MSTEIPSESVQAAKRLFEERGRASVSLLQRQFNVGHSDALRIIDALKQRAGPEQRGEQTELPVNNAIFPENRRHGLLLCGINHGYSKNDERMDSSGQDRSNPFKSFFCDERVENHDFRTAVQKWFALWGYHLQSDWRLAQAFDRSLVHTNWLQSASNNVRGMNVRKACIEDAASFLGTCEALRPGLILFFSKELLWAFLGQALRPRVESIFGPIVGDTEWVQEAVPGVIQFKVGFQRFRDMTAISLPHATGARGVTDRYISALADRMSKEIDGWWAEHQRRLQSSAT